MTLNVKKYINLLSLLNSKITKIGLDKADKVKDAYSENKFYKVI